LPLELAVFDFFVDIVLSDIKFFVKALWSKPREILNKISEFTKRFVLAEMFQTFFDVHSLSPVQPPVLSCFRGVLFLVDDFDCISSLCRPLLGDVNIQTLPKFSSAN